MVLFWHLAYSARMNKKIFKSRASFMALVGKKVHAARKKFGWRQDELGAFAGISNVYISHIESGKNNISLFILYQLAETLELEIAELLPTAKEIDEIKDFEGEDS